MHRLIFVALAAIALAAISAAPAAGQAFTLPEIGLQASGACPQIAVRERAGKTMVPLGCLDGTAKVVRWSGDGSGISLTPSTTAASGTLARLMADRAPLASPALSGVATNTSAAGCVSSTAGNWTGDNTATWVPSCYGTWMSDDPDKVRLHLTRGTTSSNGIYPPQPGSGTAQNNQGTNHLIQTRADGGKPIQTSGAIINLDVVGGSFSQAHPSDAQSPNATGMLISSHQRPGAGGEPPAATWALNLDHVTGPGSGNTQSYGVELDLSNFNKDCGVGTGCLSAWYFYGGINAFPNLAFHYFSNPHTATYSGTATASGNTFTLSSGQFHPNITKLSYAGSTYRVDCNTTTCTADVPLGTVSTPGSFTGKNAMAHYGLMFQDSDGGTQVQDADLFTNDASRYIIQAAGNHRAGLDFTQDAMPYAAFFKGGQQVCYNGAAACMSYSGGLNAWLFAPGTNPAASVARISTAGDANFAGVVQAGGIVAAAGFGAGGVVGVSCSGAPTANFQTINGIVTRC